MSDEHDANEPWDYPLTGLDKWWVIRVPAKETVPSGEDESTRTVNGGSRQVEFDSELLSPHKTAREARRAAEVFAYEEGEADDIIAVVKVHFRYRVGLGRHIIDLDPYADEIDP